MNYPNGQKRRPLNQEKSRIKNNIYSNRGMTLEEDINVTNEYYLEYVYLYYLVVFLNLLLLLHIMKVITKFQKTIWIM